jgi:hypothetical protein
MNPRAHAIKTHQIVLTPDKSDYRTFEVALIRLSAVRNVVYSELGSDNVSQSTY